ncbi:MAG: hypothetical protein JWO31_2141, partial [Phycisphaerales bacterium]|nr:hypothetical protein [Phycisphaerales bacterium]
MTTETNMTTVPNATRSKRSTLIARSAAAAALALLPVLARAAGPNGDAPPNEPEAERAAFKVADGFDVTLFAAEPMLLKPIGMNFDAAGRLWVAGSQTYPQVKPGDVPNDKVFVLEDTDGDGKADKSTVFAEGLFLPTSVLPGDGGVYVANSTEMVFLKDTDGDGKADYRRVVLSGFGTEDTHHVIHGFRWDFGGRLNFLQGIYVGSRIETPRGTKVGLASTLWQLRPDSMELGIFCQGLVNPWGVTWDRYGQMFLTDGAGGEGVNFAPPGTAFTAADGATRVLKGLNPGSPKYCGAEIIDGRLFPADWQGDLITNDFRANRTVRFKLTPDGSGFAAKLMPDVIASGDRAYRPVDVKMGPDGAMYIADWYNPIIQHGEVDFRDARRDKVHGRIWRLAPKGSKPLAKPKLAGASVDVLLTQLAAPEQWTRLEAKQQLKAMGPEKVVPALAEFVKAAVGRDPGTLKPGEPVHDVALEALWAYETLDVVNADLLRVLLKSPTPDVRAAAVRVLAHWAVKTLRPEPRAASVGMGMDPVAAAAALATDDQPRVRLEAIRALADIGRATNDPAAAAAAVRATDKPLDPFIEYALYKTLSDLKDLWLPLATKPGGAAKPDGAAAPAKPLFANEDHLNYALRAVQSGDALKQTVADLKAGKVPAARRAEAYDLVAAVGEPADLRVLLDHAADAKADPTVRRLALAALEKAARQRKAAANGPVPAQVQKLLADRSAAVQESAARLAGLYKVAEARTDLESKLAAPTTPAGVRSAAAVALADLGPQGTAALEKSAAPTQPPAVRAAAIAGLAGADLKAAATAAADFLTTAKAGEDPSAVLGAFLRREGGTAALAAALSGKKLPPDTAKLALRYVQGVGVDLGPLGETIRSSSGTAGGGAVQLSADDMKATVADVLAKGDAARGEAVYRSKAASCTQCHMIGGVGGPLAPDLRAIGATSPVDYLVDSILAPNKAVKDGYAATSVSTKDGDLIQGIKVREDAKELVLRDNARDEIPIPLADIKKRTEGGSLMPAGLQDGLTRQEFLDLVRFLSELGKPGPYAVPTTPVVRRWRSLDPVPPELAAAEPGKPATGAAAAALSADAPGWYPLYGTVAGDLSTADLPTATGASAGGSKVAFVRFDIDVAAAGPVKLVLNDPAGLSAWADGKPLAGGAAAAGKELT